MNLETKIQYKYILKLSSAAGKTGEMIMQNVFNSGFIIEKDRVEGSILFYGYEQETGVDKPLYWEKLLDQLQKNKKIILDRGGYVLKRKRAGSVDWVEKWKENFQEIKVGSDWIIIPSWQAEKQDLTVKEKNKLNTARIPLIVKPGVAFGSGNHPSTQLVLHDISEIKSNFPELASFLDVGCGTGILSLAAGKIDFKHITAIDIDELSVKNTRDNLELNGLADKVEVINGDIKEISLPKYDLVVVNCLPKIIKDILPGLLPCLEKNSFLILSGFMKQHKSEIKHELNSWGRKLKFHKIDSLDNWLSFIVQRKAGDK